MMVVQVSRWLAMVMMLVVVLVVGGVINVIPLGGDSLRVVMASTMPVVEVKKNMPVVVVVTAFTENIRDYSVHSTLLKRIWCEQHDYRLVVHRGLSSLFPLRNETKGRKNPAPWEKVIAMQQHVRNSDENTWIVWMDADAMPLLSKPKHVASEGDPIRDAIQKYASDDSSVVALFTSDTNLLGAPDWREANYAGVPPEYLINTGVFIVRGGRAGDALLNAVWEEAGEGEEGEARLAERFDIHADLKRQARRDPALRERLPDSFFTTTGWPWEQGAFWQVLTTRSALASATRTLPSSALNRIGVDVPPSCFDDNLERPTGGEGMAAPIDDQDDACSTSILHMAGWTASQRINRATWELAHGTTLQVDGNTPAWQLEGMFATSEANKIPCMHPICLTSSSSSSSSAAAAL